jgi:hypothetical protein
MSFGGVLKPDVPNASVGCLRAPSSKVNPVKGLWVSNPKTLNVLGFWVRWQTCVVETA